MENLKLTIQQYAKLKTLAYQVYMKDMIHSGMKARNIMSRLLEEFHYNDLHQIISNTFLFPFDIELHNFLIDRKFDDETMEQASIKFHIPIDLVKQKVKEYAKYRFINCVGEGLIDYNITYSLSNQLLEQDYDTEKNKKVS